jgi:hypothetical protein
MVDSTFAFKLELSPVDLKEDKVKKFILFNCWIYRLGILQSSLFEPPLAFYALYPSSISATRPWLTLKILRMLDADSIT